MLKNPNAILAAAPDVFPPDNFNAGVLIIRPSYETLRHMLSLVAEIEPYDGGDTGFLNHYYPGWYDNKEDFVALPYTFNAQRTL